MRRLRRDEAGNVIIITALMMTTLLGFLALVVDVGSLLVRHSSLQTGADAAALAVAKRCADAVVSGGVACSDSIADGVVDENLLDAAATVDVDTALQTSHSGRAGRITVESTTSQNPYFASALGITGQQTVQATATARWGPLTAEDAVFPLVVCKGALPDPNTSQVTLVVDPTAETAPTKCDGADAEQPFGWIRPDDAADCTAKITLLPPTYLDVRAADTPPTEPACGTSITELLHDIRRTDFCHTTRRRGYHCHTSSSPAVDRQRVIAVYDAAAGGRPSYSLVAFEFTGARFGGMEAHRGAAAACPDGMECIRGYVRNADPPTDGPIVDAALAALPGIADTTVLDIRLVD